MLIATLAIAAMPPFSGYFSKDLILEAAYESGHTWLWFLGVITAGLTSFYMFRLIFMTFFGDSRVDADKEHHIHESPAVMTIPLIVLAILATVGGWVDLPDGWLVGQRVRAIPRAGGRHLQTGVRGELDFAVAARERRFDHRNRACVRILYPLAGNPDPPRVAAEGCLRLATQQVLHRRTIQSDRHASAVLDIGQRTQPRDRQLT